MSFFEWLNTAEQLSMGMRMYFGAEGLRKMFSILPFGTLVLKVSICSVGQNTFDPHAASLPEVNAVVLSLLMAAASLGR